MRKKYKKNKHWKFFPRSFHSLGIYKIHISGAANRHAPVQRAKYVVVFSTQSSWYEPFTSFVSFSSKNIIIYWLILTMNHQGSYFPFVFVFIQWVKHFCTPPNCVTIWSTELNSNNKKYIQLMFGWSKLYTNIQQDQKAKLDYHMSMLFAHMAGWDGVGC